MRLPNVIRAGSQPTRRRQRPRRDPAAFTRSHGSYRSGAPRAGLDLMCASLSCRGTRHGQRSVPGRVSAGTDRHSSARARADLSEVTLVAAAGTALNNGDGINGRLHLIGVAGDRPIARFPQLAGLMQILDEAGRSKPGRTGPHPPPCPGPRQAEIPAGVRKNLRRPSPRWHPITMASTVRLLRLLPHR
jgi:hypothetical protein